MNITKLFTSLFCIATLSLNSAHAENWKSAVKKSKTGNFPALKPIHLTYSASWSSALKSGKVSFIFDKKDKRYPNLYISQSYGGSAFNTLMYNFNMTSFSKKKSLKPVLLISDEKDKKERVVTTNKYKSASVTHKKVTTPVRSSTVETRKHIFKAPSVHDPLTAMLFVRSQKLYNGQKVKLCIHPFSSPYYAVVTVLGREKHMGQNAIKLDVALRKIDKNNGNLVTYKKLKKATIWLSDDANRIPLEFRLNIKLAGYVNLGDVRLKLVAKQKP